MNLVLFCNVTLLRHYSTVNLKYANIRHVHVMEFKHIFQLHF